MGLYCIIYLHCMWYLLELSHQMGPFFWSPAILAEAEHPISEATDKKKKEEEQREM